MEIMCKLPDPENPENVTEFARQQQELVELREYKAKMTKLTDAVMKEQCNVNQRHCACVPVLRAHIAQLGDLESGTRRILDNMALLVYASGAGIGTKTVQEYEALRDSTPAPKR